MEVLVNELVDLQVNISLDTKIYILLKYITFFDDKNNFPDFNMYCRE